MKVLDHVPPTMHNFVTEAFKTIYMGHDCFLGPAEPCPANPQLWRKFFGADGWNRQGAYDFGATFTGRPTDPYRTHKIEAHLLISCLYDDVYIEWVMGYVGPCRITVDLFDGQGEGMLAHLETPQHGFEVDNILCGGREWLEKEFSKHVWEFVNAT